MKILVYGLNFWPEITGVGKYTGEMVEWLANQGNEVRVITTSPYYPGWKTRSDYHWWRYYSEEHSSIKVSRCPLWVPETPTGKTRLLHLASFAFSSLPMAFWECSQFRPDAIVTLAPTLFSAPATILLSRLFSIPAWLHIQDFEVDAAFNLHILSFSALQKLALFLERLILKRFQVVSTITGRMQKRLGFKGLSPKKTYVFPNWVDTKLIRPLTHPSIYRKKLGIENNAIVALYSGTMGGKHGLDIFFDTVCTLPEVIFVFCGEGGMVEPLKRHTQNCQNVHFLPLQPVEELNELLNLADIHLLPQKRNAADLVMPSKITGMFASGRPIVSTADPGTQLFLATTGRGLCVPPEEPDAFIEAIRALAASSEKRIHYGQEARRYAETFWDKERILGQFLQKLQTLAKKEPQQNL